MRLYINLFIYKHIQAPPVVSLQVFFVSKKTRCAKRWGGTQPRSPLPQGQNRQGRSQIILWSLLTKEFLTISRSMFFYNSARPNDPGCITRRKLSIIRLNLNNEKLKKNGLDLKHLRCFRSKPFFFAMLRFKEI